MSLIGLDQISQEHLNTAGGKGANLGELIKQGFPVPPGFVVGAQEYAVFLDGLDIPANDDIPADTEAFLADIRTKILATPLNESLLDEIERHHEILAATRPSDLVYAVRSSATAEDLADASFAGQHDTYYYVTADSIGLMVKKCWASLWSNAAFSYRHTQGIEHRTVYMAVVVQEMVRSDVSGVTFTADPVSGNNSVIITESSWGMGAAIVDGRVSPDQYLVDKKSNRLTSIKISDKKFMVPARVEPERGARLVEVPANLRRMKSLTDEQVAEIAALATRAEAHFGSPQDLEWAIQDGQLFLLQSRPITIMGSAEEDEPVGRYILFKPIAENFTDPLMPLTEDIMVGLVPMMKVIHGRVYVNFNHVRSLIPLKMSDEDIARLGYLSEPKNQNPGISIPRMLMLGIVLFFNYLVMGVFNRRTAAMPDDFMASYRQYFTQVARDQTITAPNALIKLFLKFRFFEPVGNMVLLVNLIAPRYMLMLRLTRALLLRWAPELSDDTASLLCSGTEGVLSTQMGHDILGLAKIAKRSSTVSELLKNKQPKDAVQAIRDSGEGGEFITALTEFLAMHGHRALKEFELNSVRWEEDPSPVLGMVRNYLLVDTNLEQADSSIKAQRESLKQQVRNELRALPYETLGNPRTRLIEALIEQTKYYMKLRENSRFYHIMAFYAVRLKILKIEQELLSKKVMKCKDDIFYLHWNEVVQLQTGESDWTDVEDTIRARRMEHIRRGKMVPPKTIGMDIEEVEEYDDEKALSGQGASPGRYEGIARVIMDPATDNEIEPGEILIAPYTDPAWTPLFLTANAAVIEVGSYLSHAGTIAREYGMPCVVDVANCTSKITTGTRISVNGSSGKVTILTQQEPI